MFSIDKTNRIMGIIDTISSSVDLEGMVIEFLHSDESVELIPIDKIFDWEMSRAKETLPALRGLDIAIENDIESCENREKVLQELHLAQLKLLDISNLKQELSWQTSFAHYVTLGISFFSNVFSHTSSVKIRIPYCNAEKFVEWITKIYLTKTLEDKVYCLIACPDHYLFQTNNTTNQLCIGEVTGGSSLISYYQITLNDTSGISTPANADYPYQLIGTFYSEDGSKLGGMRHQFRTILVDEDSEEETEENKKKTVEYCEAWLNIDFPTYYSSYLIQGHRYHLACEWIRWFQMYNMLINERNNH